MPADAEILTVQLQNQEVVLWAKVNPSAVTERRLFIVQPTGIEFDDLGLKYIGTVQFAHGFVGHVFEATL